MKANDFYFEVSNKVTSNGINWDVTNENECYKAALSLIAKGMQINILKLLPFGSIDVESLYNDYHKRETLKVTLTNGETKEIKAGAYVLQVWGSGCWNNLACFLLYDDAKKAYNKLAKKCNYIRLEQFN